jgi:hypothetical protein
MDWTCNFRHKRRLAHRNGQRTKAAISNLLLPTISLLAKLDLDIEQNAMELTLLGNVMVTLGIKM